MFTGIDNDSESVFLTIKRMPVMYYARSFGMTWRNEKGGKDNKKITPICYHPCDLLIQSVKLELKN